MVELKLNRRAVLALGLLAVPQIAQARAANWAKPVAISGLPNLNQVAPNLYRSAQPTAEGFVAAYHLRQPNQKFHAVNALKALNFQVLAAGDSYNDTGMLGAADAGFFIHPPPGIVAQFPKYKVHHDYASLRASIDAASLRLAGGG